MTFISYAQNFEDVMLWRALKHIESGFYVDIGAAWPNTDSVTKAFYDRGWHGLNIEPNPRFHEQLSLARPRDLNLQIAVGCTDGAMTLNLIDGTGLSTLDSKIAENHRARGRNAIQREVQVRTLSSIWREYIPHDQQVHFLKIDVEGFEKAVLKGNDWLLHRPWIVVIEATIPLSQEQSYNTWDAIFLESNYQFVYADGLNRFYLAQEHNDLLSAFKHPPNVFDNYKLVAQHTAEARATQAEARATQAEARATQAEARATQAEARVTALLASTSWRITAPFRWSARQVHLLREFSTEKPTRTLIKNVLRRIITQTKRHPKLHAAGLVLARTLGIDALLRRLYRLPSSDYQPHWMMYEGRTDLQGLTPHAKNIFGRIKFAIEQNHTEKN